MSDIKKINCIIDTDPGVDDTVAVALSLYDEIMDIKLITTVSGNKDIGTVTRNVLHTLELFNKTDIPVAKGADKAMFRISPDASFIHQNQGMGGYIPPETTTLQPISQDAVEAMYQTILQNQGDIIIIALGPHTNVGTLINKHPDVVNRIKHIYCEGCGSYGEHETERWINHISFNASSDPEAMKIVFESGIPITIVPSRFGREVIHLTEEEVMKIKDINNVGYFIYKMFSNYWEHGYEDKRIAINDSCACIMVRFPELFKTVKVDFDINNTDTPGKTIITANEASHINYIYEVDTEKLHQRFFEGIKKLDNLDFKIEQ